MTMITGNETIFEEAKGFSEIREPDRVLEMLERRLRGFGATSIIATGLPLPHRPVNKLILRIFWPDIRNDGYLLGLDPADPILQRCLAARRPFHLRGGWLIDDSGPPGGTATQRIAGSDIVDSAGPNATILAVPLHEVHPYQGCVIAAGPDIPVGAADRAGIEFYCGAAFRRLQQTGRITGERPGDLSERERRVLELTAIGKTANEIADLLDISQRTVHAHLQNASEKLNASNKTHTVVEALRYGQITL
jgi:LuxR family transcriptional regulator, quorum-sensing system regulator BjaR1